jgi:ATP phosphoribosyltransferase regulatory subunit
MGLEDQIIIDFGLVNQADYYSSIVFRGYIRSVGEPVLSGGRYDHLLKDFGYDVPAIGFAFNVDLLSLNILKKLDDTYSAERANTHLRIALTKGRLEEDAVDLFRAMGLVDGPLLKKGRKLLLTLPGGEIDIVFAKAADVITYVEHGACDLGIVGMDTIMESGGTFYEVLNLGFGKCKFVLAAPKGSEIKNGFKIKRIATKYPKVAGDYFEDQGMDVEIIKIEGSVELAPLLTLADAIVDIMETGSTLKANGLVVLQEIQDLSARLIVNEASMKFKKREIDGLIQGIEKELGVRYAAD